MKKNKNETPTEAPEDLVQDTEVLKDAEIIVEDTISNEIESLKKSNAELVDKLQRSLAEFDNFRKRTMKEKSQMYTDGLRDTVEKLLPIVDNFERAIQSAENKEDSLYKGVDLIFRQFGTILEGLGVEKINAVGEKFDTNYHFAVAHIDDENYSENEVIEELQKGYKCKDKVIRCSMVKVAN
jgi:molecular chaperone GrpE